MGLYDRDWYRENAKVKAKWENVRETYARGTRRKQSQGLPEFAIAIGALFVAIGLVNLAKSPTETLQSLKGFLTAQHQPTATSARPSFSQSPPVQPQAAVSSYREQRWLERDPQRAPPQVTTVINNHIYIQQAPPPQAAVESSNDDMHQAYLRLKKKQDQCLYWKKHLSRYDRDLANTNIDLYCR